jgi:hypothetical protein
MQFDLKVDNVILIQLLCFWTLSIVLFLFKTKLNNFKNKKQGDE